MEFLGISFWEFLLIVVVVLVVLGPSKLPTIMRTLGTIVRNLRRITTELTASVAREMEAENARRDAETRPSPKDEAPGPEKTMLPPKPRASRPAGAARKKAPDDGSKAEAPPPVKGKAIRPVKSTPKKSTRAARPAERSTRDEQ